MLQIQISGNPRKFDSFCQLVFPRPQGGVDTGFIKHHEPELLAAEPPGRAALALAAAAYTHLAAQQVPVLCVCVSCVLCRTSFPASSLCNSCCSLYCVSAQQALPNQMVVRAAQSRTAAGAT